MPVVFARVEERLIHGQIAYAWAQAIEFDVIVVVDEVSAKDPIIKSMLEMACPRSKKLLVYSEAEACEKLNSINRKLFVIAKSPITFWHLLSNGVKIEKLNIGSIHFKSGKKEIYKTVFVSDDEIEALHNIIDSGITCEVQKLPTESKKDVKDLI
ncbi:PTS system sorbose-specific EIIB component [bioreactor metagenome]|uniref:PTS system sorbose-specific EIIB component n=1 Tax=bioreactor metagenome TaxID=1076179 RepID=A0A645BX96_9ZZZZ